MNTCATCQWLNSKECRRHPPPWPTVIPTDWCGDYVRSEAETLKRQKDRIEKREQQLNKSKRVVK
jgi:hypothetical protein